MSGWLILAIGMAIAFVDFAIGLSLLRRGGGASYEKGMELEAPAARRVGRLIMFASPLFLMVFAIIAFGWLPVAGIDPITLDQGR